MGSRCRPLKNQYGQRRVGLILEIIFIIIYTIVLIVTSAALPKYRFVWWGGFALLGLFLLELTVYLCITSRNTEMVGVKIIQGILL